MPAAKTSIKKLAGKIALVTGGSRGIGAAIAKRLAAHGATVAITYKSSRNKAAEVVAALEKSGVKALAIKADAASPTANRAAVRKTVAAFGGIDILVNNAAAAVVAPITDFADADFERMIATNIRGVFLATREAARHMKAGGRIIHIGSGNSTYIPFAGGSVYALTKSALSGFTKGLARDLGPRGITVNTVHPGPVDTDMNPASGPSAKNTKAYVALQRYGHADEVASFVAYLASPEAAFITGASLPVDGGFTA